ncbi:MAG: hypothetical protein GY832_32645 [Chloroflexi bacterium]|nr:hypothetical protein [Chloroflexota bacterium]
MLGIVGILGTIFFIMGMVFVWVFVGDLYPIDVWRLSRFTTTARATITDTATTGATENDVPVYEYHLGLFQTSDPKSLQYFSCGKKQIWTGFGAFPKVVS